MVHLGESNHRLRCGDGVILPPRVAHRYTADPAIPWTIFWFHFIGRRARDYVNSLGTDEIHPQFGIEKVETIAEAFEDCYRYTGGDWTDAELVAFTTSFARLLGLCGSLRRPQGDRRMEVEERVARALRFMRANLDRPVGLAELAGHVALSVSRFTAVFAEQMKCSPIDFHIRLKMQRASELLLSTPLSASEIAGILGYDDPFYFSRLFKQKIGLPPRDYRRHAARPGTEADASPTVGV
jgi:AraC-like DNA-binding protein